MVSNQSQDEAHPFAALAREYSEDVTTSSLGGSLGGISADRLYDWPQVLDALAALHRGEVSSPVETEFGFHVLQLREPPEPEQVSGRRLVIGYDTAPWLRAYLTVRDIPHRSRSEAELLATEIYDRARSGTGSFVDLLQEHSEHRDVLRDGDFGVWSTTEATPFPREIEQLQKLAVGALAPPIDTAYGFQILLRTPVVKRPIYATERIQWQPGSTAGVDTDDEVRDGLQKIANLLRRSPERFEEFQQSSCCAGAVDTWQAGRGSAVVEAALAPLQIGQIAAAPVREAPETYVLLRRATPRQWQREEATFALPAPARPDVVFALTATGRLELLEEAWREASSQLSLDPALAQRAVELQALRGPWQQAQSFDERRGLLIQLRKNLTDLLGVRQGALYWGLLEQVVERSLLRPGPGAFPW